VQKAGIAACVSDTGSLGSCQDGRALMGAGDVATSGDGKNVYLVAQSSGSVVIFDRDLATGALTQKPGAAGCISTDGTGGLCQTGTALLGPRGLAASSDGASLYATVLSSNAVGIFDRDPATGALTQKTGAAGCISEDGSGGSCQDGTALDQPGKVTASPDSKNVYVASLVSSAVAIFDRATPPPPPPAPAPPPPPPPAPPARDTVPPNVAGFAVSPNRFPVRGRSSFRFRLSERAAARVLIERALAGRRVGRRCVAPTRKLRKRARCTRLTRVGTLTYRNRPPGANRIPFSGRIGRRALAGGSYRATITATDAAGNRSRPRRAVFRIVRR
jgi:hypothetical protein